MPPELKTPWLRSELIRVLREFSDLTWLRSAMDNRGRPGGDLAAMYDFFDHTGVLDAPNGCIGYLLYDEQEASIMRNLGIRLDLALRDPRARGEWRRVAVAARTALNLLEKRGGQVGILGLQEGEAGDDR